MSKPVWELKKRRRSIRSGLSQTSGKHAIPHVMLGGVEHKSCGKCARLLVLSAFSPRPDAPDGLRSWCQECEKEGDAARGPR